MEPWSIWLFFIITLIFPAHIFSLISCNSPKREMNIVHSMGETDILQVQRFLLVARGGFFLVLFIFLSFL